MNWLLLELFRQLNRAAKFQDDDVILDFLTAEQLLARLEKLEAMFSIAERMHEDWEAGLDGLAIRRDFEAARAVLDAKGSD